MRIDEGKDSSTYMTLRTGPRNKGFVDSKSILVVLATKQIRSFYRRDPSHSSTHFKPYLACPRSAENHYSNTKILVKNLSKETSLKLWFHLYEWLKVPCLICSQDHNDWLTWSQANFCWWVISASMYIILSLVITIGCI